LSLVRASPVSFACAGPIVPRAESEKRQWVDWLFAGGATLASLSVLSGLLRLGEHPLLLPSFGGSCVILFAMPESTMARPRSLIGGHVLSSAIGIAFGQIFGSADWVMVAATAAALVAMQATKTVHSPAGADPIIAVASGASWSFLLQPIAVGLAVLLAASLAFNTLVRSRQHALSLRAGERLANGDEAALKQASAERPRGALEAQTMTNDWREGSHDDADG